MERIACQSRDEEELAKQTLFWITFARSPLTTSRLQHALAVEIGETELDADNMSQIEYIISACAGLVTVDTQSKVIRLAHYTTQNYFERTRSHWFSNVETNIATVCITYISFDVFDNGPCHTDADLKERLQYYPFYAYAARNWGHHARGATGLALYKQLLDFANSDRHMQASAQILFSSYVCPSPVATENKDTARVTGLHLMCYFGLEEHFRVVLPRCPDPDIKDFSSRTPLSRAAENGSNGIVRQLLRSGKIDLDSRDGTGRTPLSWAAGTGRTATVDLLVTGRAKADSQDNWGRTPLSFAAEKGHEAVVRRLLVERVNVDSKFNVFGPKSTSTLYAVRINGQEAMHMLFDGSSKAMIGSVTDSYASGPGLLKKVLDLIDKIDRSEYDGTRSGRSPLLVSVDPALGTVELVLVRGVGEPAAHGKTPLHLAAWHGHASVVKVLLDVGSAVPHTRDEFNHTPLLCAAAAGNTEVVGLLLSTGVVDARSVDAQGKTALSWATKYGYQQIVELLIEYETRAQSFEVRVRSSGSCGDRIDSTGY